MNEEIEKLLSAMTNIEARLGQLSTVEETAKVKAELAELSKKQLGLAEEIRRLKQQLQVVPCQNKHQYQYNQRHRAV